MIFSKSASKDKQSEQTRLVQDQFVTLFLQQNKRAQTGILISAVLIFLLLTDRVDPGLALMWLVLVVVVSGFRFWLTEKIVDSASDPATVIAILLLLNGLCLVLPVFAFGGFTDAERAFVSIVLIALATASAATTSGYRGIFMWFAATMLLPLGAAWILTAQFAERPWVGRGMGGLIAVYLVFLAGLGRDAFKVFDESCRIRFAERELNGRLALALESAQQASEAKTRFLAAASHDLRQPLHTIGVLVAAIGLRKLDDRSREIVGMLGSVSHSLSGQLDGLLDVSKLDAGIIKPDLEIESIDQIVQSYVASMEPTAREQGIYIKAHCTAATQVLTDANLMRRLLGNLTSNALKFTSEGGVDVTVKKDGRHAIIEVRDTGIGIAPEYQRLVFQEFYQIGNAERDRSKGLGLGLSIVQRLCALLNIELSLESSQGNGSRFTLRMLLVDAVPAPVVRMQTLDDVNIGSLQVLVVDDEADVREGMRLLLEELGCSVLLADSVEAASKRAQACPVDMVISDFRLKDKTSGVDAIRQVQLIHPNVYTLLITGDTAPDRLQQADALDIALLHKPVSLDELIKHLHKAKNHHEQ